MAWSRDIFTLPFYLTRFICMCSFREELVGLPRANNAKDVDWSKVANSISIETTTKPPPIKISVSEVLKRARPLKQTADSTALLSAVDPHGKQHRYRPTPCIGLSVYFKSKMDIVD
jgi:hypothetical protein